ncbi:YidC/Oxa1 family membrane protein insertase [Leucobacter luti]|uniref:YidC/Oxa1 family membrane protein insertase n=1 Tax=Leucobacter luti TaxID=340320 RepID=UPI003D0248FB
MNLYDFPPIHALIWAAHWAVTELSDLLAGLAGGASAALAVALLTILVRIALIPVGRSQIKASFARKRLAPRLAELQRRYRTDPQQLQRRMAELYREEGSSPFAGCLPLLAQAPVLMAIYGVFILPRIGGDPNLLLGHELFGIGLGESLAGLVGAGAAGWVAAAVFGALMLVIAVVAQGSRRLLAAQSEPAPDPDPRAKTAPNAPAIPQGAIRALSFLPFLTAVIAAFVPLAAAIYLAVSTTWTFAERWILTRTLDPARRNPDPQH